MGDRVTYNGQPGCIALVGCKPGSGHPNIRQAEWTMNESEILILFDNGAILKLDNVQDDDLLVFLSRGETKST